MSQELQSIDKMNIYKKEEYTPTLLAIAEIARGKSYCPYSKKSVGAALLAKSGRVYIGANIENVAFSPSVCAERVAFYSAIMAGEQEFTAIAISGGDRDMPPSGFTPCGVCRQVMAEFCDSDFLVFSKDGEGFTEATLSELLPHSFKDQY